MDYSRVDDPERILQGLISLAELNALAHQRHMAGYVHRLPMRSWILGGRWILDECGNTGRLEIGTLSPREVAALGFDPLLEHGAFLAQLKARGLSDSHCIADAHKAVPPDGLQCGICGMKWAINNAHFAKPAVVEDFEWMDGAQWVGKKWEEFGWLTTLPQNATALLPSTTPYIQAGDGLKRNPNLQEPSHLPYDYVIRPGDKLIFSVVSFIHCEGHPHAQ